MHSSVGIYAFRLFRNFPVLLIMLDFPSPGTCCINACQEKKAHFFNVIQYKTIPFILPGEIPFTRLSLSRTFTNTELMQPCLSLSLSSPSRVILFSQAFRSHVSNVEQLGGPPGKVCQYQLLPWGTSSEKSSFAFKYTA